MMSSFVWKRQRQTHSFIWYGLLIQDKCVDYIVYVLYICVHIYQFVKNSVSGSIANNLQEQRIPPCLVKEKISGWNFAHRHYFEMPPILLLCSAISKSPPRSLTSIATIQFIARGELRKRESWKQIVIFWLVEAVEVVDHLGSFWGGRCIESTSVSSPVKSTRLDRQRGKESVLLLPVSTTTTRRN